ncbi:MAG: hypothetical protein ACLP50_24545 [Solirubrobacteraceae bacterium]
MPAPRDRRPAPPDAELHPFGPATPAEHAPDGLTAPEAARDISHSKKRVRAFLIAGGVAAGVVLAIGSGTITLPGAQDSTQSAHASAPAGLADTQMAADQQWASATCTTVLDWKNEIQHDGTSLNLSFGALARIQDAITATARMLNEINKLGLPPAARSARARAAINQMRSDIESHVHNLQATAGSAATGNLAAIGTLLSELQNEQGVGTQIVDEIRQVVSVDLGLSLVETRACRQLVGIPI